MVGKTSFSYKKILITQNALQRIQGSEMVCLELAQFFKSIGVTVKVYTWHLGEPMKSLFDSTGIEVITDDEDKFFDECDFVWVQHQVIPQPLLRRLSLINPTKPQPIFVFFHMSAQEKLYLEQPYICNLEQKIASMVLFVSLETRDTLDRLNYLDNIACPKKLFPNPAPEAFTHLLKKKFTPPAEY